MHMVATCEKARRVWYLSPLHLVVDVNSDTSLIDWCIALHKTFSDGTWWSIFWSLLWGICLRRNAWIFNKKLMGQEEGVE